MIIIIMVEATKPSEFPPLVVPEELGANFLGPAELEVLEAASEGTAESAPEGETARPEASVTRFTGPEDSGAEETDPLRLFVPRGGGRTQ